MWRGYFFLFGKLNSEVQRCPCRRRGCRWEWGGAGPCAEIVLLLFPKRWQSCSSWEHSSALPVPLSRVWVWSHVKQWDGRCVTLWNRGLGKLFLGERLPASPRGWHCAASVLARAEKPCLGENLEFNWNEAFQGLWQAECLVGAAGRRELSCLCCATSSSAQKNPGVGVEFA